MKSSESAEIDTRKNILPAKKSQVPALEVTPLHGFDPMKATNTDLLKYGYPPRPDKQCPRLRALWERSVIRP